MKILAVNDDGVRAEGFNALINELRKIGEVTAVAPETERSAAGHSVTFYHPIRFNKLTQEDRFMVYSCSGTPSDCVILGLAHIIKENPPDIIVSGINYGPNLGDDVTYSGTISAAMEGAQAGIPAIAISTGISKAQNLNYSNAAKTAASLCKLVNEHKIPYRTLLNVNVPAENINGVKITHLGISRFQYGFITRQDAGEREYQWLIRNPQPESESYEGSDYQALEQDYISITPIKLDFNDYKTAAEMIRWDLGLIGK